MYSTFQQREKKVVPRFRRKNENKNFIDADDEEARKRFAK